MRLAIIKAIVVWLIKYLEGYHLHKDPGPKRSKFISGEQLRQEQDMAERRDEVGL